MDDHEADDSELNNSELDAPELEAMADCVPIPKIFHSVYEAGPFSKCIVCTKALLDDETDYMVEKIFRGTETIVEYAICSDCAVAMYSELSAESTGRIEQYLSEKINWQSRLEMAMGTHGDDIAQWIDTCLVTGRPRDQLPGYQLCARCRVAKLQRFIFPLMIAGDVSEDIGRLLSKKTRDRMDGFVDEYLGLSPEYRDIFDGTPLLMV